MLEQAEEAIRPNVDSLMMKYISTTKLKHICARAVTTNGWTWYANSLTIIAT